MADLQFHDPDRFTTGAIGPPGERVFFLQVGEGERLASLRLEKQQVAALADSLASILADGSLTSPLEPALQPLELVGPVVPEWIVGAIGVAYDETSDRILIAVEEIPSDDLDDTDEEEDILFGPGDDEREGAATVRFLVTRAQATAFVDHARDVVAAGRPPCPWCGAPLDPEGHACPRMN